MNRVLKYCLAIALGLGIVALAPLRSQEPAPKEPPPTDIFSGTVTKLTEDSVTVVRKVLGHDAVTRQFARDGGTRVEGKLRERARVTVRYRTGEEGVFVAVFITVR